MTMTKTAFLLATGLAAGILATASAASAQTTTSGTGPYGGTGSVTQGCGANGNACARRWTYTSPRGKTVSGGGYVRKTVDGGYVSARGARGPQGGVVGARRSTR